MNLPLFAARTLIASCTHPSRCAFTRREIDSSVTALSSLHMALSFSFSSADLALALPDPAPRLLPPPASASFPPRLTFSFSSVPPATVAAPRLAFSFAGGGDAARRERPAAGARAAALAVSYLSSPGSEARRLEIREGDLLEMAALQRLKVSARSLAAAVSFGFRYDRFERERLGDDASTAHRALQAPGVVAFMRFLTLGARLGTAAGREIPLAEAPDEADADDAARLAGDEISQLIQGSEGRLVCVSTWERYFQGFQLLADLFSEKGWRPLSSEDSRAYQMALTGLKRLRPHITHQMLQMPPLLLLTACEWMRTGDDFHKELALMAMLQFQCALCPIELSGDHFRNVDVFRSDEPNFLPVSAALGPPFFVLHIRDRKVKDSPLDYYVRVLRLEDEISRPSMRLATSRLTCCATISSRSRGPRRRTRAWCSTTPGRCVPICPDEGFLRAASAACARLSSRWARPSFATASVPLWMRCTSRTRPCTPATACAGGRPMSSRPKALCPRPLSQ
jgi:hypothetical protein